MKNYHAERAKELLWHYFRIAGVPDDLDCRLEVDEIVERIIWAVMEEIKKERKE